jgi:hypothetical protein
MWRTETCGLSQSCKAIARTKRIAQSEELAVVHLLVPAGPRQRHVKVLHLDVPPSDHRDLPQHKVVR